MPSELVTLIVGLGGGGAASALIQSARVRATEDAKQIREDAGRLIGLLAKHGANWAGEHGTSAPVDAYEAAARLAGHPRATSDQVVAANFILESDPEQIRQAESQLRQKLGVFSRPGLAERGWARITGRGIARGAPQPLNRRLNQETGVTSAALPPRPVPPEAPPPAAPR